MLLPCQPFPDHPPTTTCETLFPKHNKHKAQPLSKSPYSIVVSNYSYIPGQELQVNITVSRPHKGFLIQARAEGNRNPVGQFKGQLDDGAVFIWCSGGLAKVIVPLKLWLVKYFSVYKPREWNFDSRVWIIILVLKFFWTWKKLSSFFDFRFIFFRLKIPAITYFSGLKYSVLGPVMENTHSGTQPKLRTIRIFFRAM